MIRETKAEIQVEMSCHLRVAKLQTKSHNLNYLSVTPSSVLSNTQCHPSQRDPIASVQRKVTRPPSPGLALEHFNENLIEAAAFTSFSKRRPSQLNLFASAAQ